MAESKRIRGVFRPLAETAVSLLLAQGLSALFTILVARQLGPKSVGDLALVYTTATIGSIGFNWGFDLWLHRELLARPGQNRHLVMQVGWIKIRLGLLIVPSLALLWWLFSGRQDLSLVLATAGVELVCDGVTNCLCVGFHSEGRHLQGSALTVVQRFLKLGALLTVASLDLASLPVIAGARMASAVLLLTPFLVADGRKSGAQNASLATLSLLRASGSYAATNGLAMAYGQADVILLGLLLPNTDVAGQYSQALNMLASLMLMPHAAYLVFIRRIAARISQNDRALLIREVRRLVWVFVAIGLFMALVCVAVAPSIIRILLGGAFTESSWLVSLQAGTAVLKSINLGLSAILVVSYIRRPRALAQLISLLVNLSLNLFLIPHFQALGSVAAYTLSEATLALGYSYLIARRFRLKEALPPSSETDAP